MCFHFEIITCTGKIILDKGATWRRLICHSGLVSDLYTWCCVFQLLETDWCCFSVVINGLIIIVTLSFFFGSTFFSVIDLCQQFCFLNSYWPLNFMDTEQYHVNSIETMFSKFTLETNIGLTIISPRYHTSGWYSNTRTVLSPVSFTTISITFEHFLKLPGSFHFLSFYFFWESKDTLKSEQVIAIFHSERSQKHLWFDRPRWPHPLTENEPTR